MKTVIHGGLAIFFAIAAMSVEARASTIYTATLDGTQEVPPTLTSATGTADLTLNGNILDVMVSFTGLTTGTVASHIHCCAPVGSDAPIAIPFTGFPTGVTSGSYTNTFDLTSDSVYNAAFLSANGGTAAGAEAALLAGFGSTMSYVNIHTTMFPAGEISGYVSLHQSAVPEPSTLILSASMLAGIIVLRRRK